MQMKEELASAYARATWNMVEPIHGAVYFAPEARARYAELGVDGTAGYFGSRAAALGPASAELVIATFYNFNPERVRSVVPAVWRTASPEKLLAARLAAADATLRRILGSAVQSPRMERAAELAREAAGATLPHPQGRPLFAAHAALPWPREPHLALWHAQTLLREFRGDGHITTLLGAGLDGIEALVTHAAAGPVTAEALRRTRAWSEEQWARAVQRLHERGWLTEGPALAFTPEGRERRERVEHTTDELSALPYVAIGPEKCAELRRLVRPYSLALAEELLPWRVGSL
ncbi:hypothetical protein [Streptomyces sp. NPDC046759]|uniref:SCO6745 family protein n=1 Tax=Streptomyces sp. NPDC046759 TaxID=3155019 RepID=UPI0033E1589D